MEIVEGIDGVVARRGGWRETRRSRVIRKAAMQVAAAESTAGHVRVAEEIRAIIAKMPATVFRKPQGPVVDIAAPRRELANIGHREEQAEELVPTNGESVMRRVATNLAEYLFARWEKSGKTPRQCAARAIASIKERLDGAIYDVDLRRGKPQ